MTAYYENKDLNITTNAKDLSNKIKMLYNANFVTFLSQVSQNANKVSHGRSETLKKVPDYVKTAIKNSNEGD